MPSVPVSPPSAPMSLVAPIIALPSMAPASISTVTASGSSASGSSKTATTASTATLTTGFSTVPTSSTVASSSQQQQQQQQQPPPTASTSSSVSAQRRAAVVPGASASGRRLQPNLPSVSAQRDIAEARQAIDASIANLLDTQLQDRATLMHENMRAIANQQRDLGRAVAGLRKANDGLAKLVHEFTGSYKEMGHVQNWAEIQYQNISVLEETMRLVRERRAREEQREERRRLREERRRQRLENAGELAEGEMRAGEREDGQCDGDDGDDDSWSSSASYSGSYSGSYTGSSRSHSQSRSAAGEGEAIAAEAAVAVTSTATGAESIDAIVEADILEAEPHRQSSDKGKAVERVVVLGLTKATSDATSASASADTVGREANVTYGLEDTSAKNSVRKGKGKQSELVPREEVNKQLALAPANMTDTTHDMHNGRGLGESDGVGKDARAEDALAVQAKHDETVLAKEQECQTKGEIRDVKVLAAEMSAEVPGTENKTTETEETPKVAKESIEAAMSHDDRTEDAKSMDKTVETAISAETNATAMSDMNSEDLKRELLMSLPDAPTAEFIEDTLPGKAVEVELPQLG